MMFMCLTAETRTEWENPEVLLRSCPSRLRTCSHTHWTAAGKTEQAIEKAPWRHQPQVSGKKERAVSNFWKQVCLILHAQYILTVFFVFLKKETRHCKGCHQWELLLPVQHLQQMKEAWHYTICTVEETKTNKLKQVNHQHVRFYFTIQTKTSCKHSIKAEGAY